MSAHGLFRRSLVAALAASSLAAAVPVLAVPQAGAATLAPDPSLLGADAFGRANASSLGKADHGGTWSAHNLTFGIRDGKAAVVGGGGEGVALLDAGSANVRITTAMTLSTGNASPGLALRAADQNNQLTVGLTRRTGADRLTLHKIHGGTYTTLAEVSNMGLVAGRTYQVTVEADGPTIRVTIDGTPRLTHTLSAADHNTFNTNRTKHGLRAFASSNSENGGSRWDDFAVHTLATTAPTPPPTTTTPPPTQPAPAPTPPPQTVVPVGPLNTIDTVVYDMWGAPFRSDGTMKNGVRIGAAPYGRHEAAPVGLPRNFDWYEGSRLGSFGPAGSGTAVSGWGQIFEAEPGTSTYDVRVQVRDFQLFFLMNDGRWVERRPDVDDRMIEGGYWNGHFRSQMGATVRDERNNGGGSSSSLRPMVQDNHATLHFWWKGWFPREVIPSGAVGIFTTAQMRLIPDTNPNVDLSRARFIGSIAADNYGSTNEVAHGTVVTAVMQPRMKYITANWQAFNGTNLSEEQLRRNPPPLR
jgi:hypothetical protein